MKLSPGTVGFKLVELMFTTALMSAVGLILYSILYSTTILGAKNTALNVAHQQARVTMIDMLQHLHSAVSVPALSDATGTPYPSPVPTAGPGISFQQWSSGPHKLKNDVVLNATQIHLALTPNAGPAPVAGQRLIIPAYQIEADISAVSGNATDFLVTLANISGPALTPPITYPVSTMPVAITGTGSSAGDIVCFVTNRCSYAVSGSKLFWKVNGNQAVIGNDMTNSTPFSIPITPGGPLYSRFVSAFDLSTSSLLYSNRGFKSANILLNGKVPIKAQLTTYP